MGQQLGTAVGFVAGFFLPGGPQVWAGIGGMVGGIISPEQIQGPKIGEVAQQTAQEGTPRPIIFARSQPIAGNVIADGGVVIKKKKESGKGGPEVTTESAYRTYAVGVCEGPGVVLLQAWKNGQLVFDLEDSAMSADNAEFEKYARWFDGSYDQMPSPDLEAALGVGNVHGHRGTAYCVFAKEDVTDQRGAWSQWTFRVGRYVDAPSGMWWAVEIPESALETDRYLWRAGNDLSFPAEGEFRGPPNTRLLSGTRNTAIVRTGSGGVILHGPEGVIEIYEGYTQEVLPPPTVVTIFTSGHVLQRIRAFGNGVCVATVSTMSVYFVSADNGHTWDQFSIPVARRMYDIGQLESGRWVSYFSNGSEQSFVYSDEELPINWVEAESAGTNPNTEGTAIVTSGNHAFMTGTVARMFSTEGGAVWTQTATGTVGSDGNAQSVGFEFGGTVIFGDTNRTHILRGTNNGASWETIEIGRTVRNISYGSGAWVLSGTPGSPTILVSRDDGAAGTWATSVMPTDPLNTEEWVVGFVDPPFDYRNGYYPLPLVIQELADRVKAGTHIDTSRLNGYQCRGFTVTSNYPCYSALQALSQVFFFSPANISGDIHFVPMGADTVATITDADMLDTGEDIEAQLRRGDTISVPRVLHLNYFDVQGGLSTDKQRSERPEGARTFGEQSLQTSVILSADEAATVVHKSHAMLVESQKGELTFALPDNWLALTESDPVFVQFDGRTVRAVIQQVETDDGEQTYKALRDRQSIHSMVVEGFPPGVPTPPPSRVIGPTRLEILDIPMWRDRDDTLGFYVAVSGLFPAWQGATVELSIDGGANYIYSASAYAESTMGSTTSDLADHPQEFPDSVNSVQVAIATPDTTLEGTTLAGMLNRLNLAVIGDELVQFADVDEVSEGVWDLSYFLRGRRDSDTEAHEIGERFVLLDSSVVFIPAELIYLNHTLTFRATSFGTLPEDGVVKTITFTGRNQQERRPGYVQVAPDGANWVVTWQGVGRLGGGANAAMGPNYTGARVTVTDGVATNIQDVGVGVHEVTVPTAGFTLPITVSVQQRNQFTGLGPATEVTYGNA